MAPVRASTPVASRGERWARFALVGWLAAVIVIAAIRIGGAPGIARALASSPVGAIRGDLVELLTSGLVIEGQAVAQIAFTLLVAVLLVRRLDARAFWLAAFAGHVVATLLVYAGVGAIWLVDPDRVRAALDTPDYGISAILAGAVGALVAAAVRSRRALELVIALGAVAALIYGVGGLHPTLTGFEHVLAVLLGAASVPARARLTRRRARRRRPGRVLPRNGHLAPQ